MDRQKLPHVLWDLAKILGGVVKDTLDMSNYRNTITVDKRMSTLDVEIITKKLKELVEKK